MVRPITAISTIVLTILIWSGTTATVHADPAVDAGTDVCTFTLSQPQRVLVSGVDMVTATLSAYPCVGDAIPTKTEACVQMQDSDGPGQCENVNSQSAPAQVYFAPYRKGATYTSRGSGCVGLFKAPYTSCQSLGPKVATL